MVAAYALPAAAVWLAVGLALGAMPLAGLALAAVAAYGGCYGLIEVSGRGGLPVPGRRWQVPQTMLIDAAPGRRVLVWGAILGSGFLTRNPYAGFGALPLTVAAMHGPVRGLALGAAVGAAHGTARASGLLRDIRELRPVPAMAGAVVQTHLDLLLKTVYWRRADGAVLLALALAAVCAATGYLT